MSVRVYAVVEGQTEEAFFKGVLAPALRPYLDITPVLLKKTGGNPRWARARGDIERLLKQEGGTFVTTMFDLYGLGTDWPGRPGSPIADGIAAAKAIEAACVRTLASELGCGVRVPERFLPHIQPFEFEGLLFSEPGKLSPEMTDSRFAAQLATIRGLYSTPEHINDSPETAPSKRIQQHFPAYKKVLHGNEFATEIGLAAMRRECAHFREWIERLESIESLSR